MAARGHSYSLRGVRRITVFSSHGLANRLMVWTSGQVLAQAAGADIALLWPLGPECGAPWERLFAPDPRVEVVGLEALAGLPMYMGSGTPPPDLLRPGNDVVGHTHWLVRPATYPAHAPLWPAVQAAVRGLRVAPAIAERVAEVARGFRPRMIGVHLRRGDFLSFLPTMATNADEALTFIAHELRRTPDAGIFLATDDGARVDLKEGSAVAHDGVRERLQERFGDRVVSLVPRSLDRSAPEAIEDALVDLWLLRRTDVVVGTRNSSFSILAAFGRDVKLHLAGGSAELVARIEQVARRARLYGPIMLAARWRLGRPAASFHEAWVSVRETPLADGIVRGIRRLRPGWRP